MFVIVSLSLLLAQDTLRAPAALELREAYRIAERQNPRIAAARARSDAVRARAASARRPPDPQLQLGAMNYSLPQWRAMDVLGMTQLQAMQMVPLGGKLRLAGRAADQAADAEADRAIETWWEVRAKTAMAFYDLYVADQSLRVDRETLRLLQDVLGVAEAMYRVGEGRQADVLRAQVELARMVQDTLRMTAMRAAMAARLSALVNGPLQPVTPALPVFPDTAPTLHSLVDAALGGRPMLRAGASEVAAAATTASLVRRDIWPDLNVGVQYAQRGGMGGTERMGSVMIGASLPVFARSRQFRMRDEAAAMLAMTRADLESMRAETNAAVIEAHASLTRARALAAQYRMTLLPQAEAATASAQASYRVGRVDFMTLLDNRMAVNRFRKELAELEAEEGKAWSDLEMLTSRELFDARSAPASVSQERRTP